MRHRYIPIAALAVLAWGSVFPEPSSPPRLVVVVVIDQFRTDYLYRFSEHYLPPRDGERMGGIRFLMEEGAVYRNARYLHQNTSTGPGHAAILTGAPPSRTGIVGNWWMDRRKEKIVGCVADPGDRMVGGGREPATARNLLAPTVGDELEQATAGRSRTVSIAYKDRSAILLGGHSADTVLWIDFQTGSWVSSAYYFPSGSLPGWVAELNRERWFDRYRGREWKKLLPEAAYQGTRPVPESRFRDDFSLGAEFPHPLPGPLSGLAKFFQAYSESGYGNDYLFEAAKRAVETEKLGADETADLLAISLSTNDFIGHSYGPNSPEVLDQSVRTDRGLADFLNFLAGRVGAEHLVVVLTSDHGIPPIPEELTAGEGSGGRLSSSGFKAAVDEALDRQFGKAKWIAAFTGSNLYLRNKAIRRSGRSRQEVETAAAAAALEQTGVRVAYPRSLVLDGRLPATELAPMVYNGFHPGRSGDVMVILKPNWIRTLSMATTHGSPYPYDSRVPVVIWGKGIRPGVHYREVSPMDIASTLSRLLGIGVPEGNVGEPLREALE